MYSKNNGISDFEKGDLVKHKRYILPMSGVGIVLNVKELTQGYDIQVMWSEGRIVNHHSNCLELI